jgi:hypothetical protein
MVTETKIETFGSVEKILIIGGYAAFGFRAQKGLRNEKQSFDLYRRTKLKQSAGGRLRG